MFDAKSTGERLPPLEVGLGRARIADTMKIKVCPSLGRNSRDDLRRSK